MRVEASEADRSSCGFYTIQHRVYTRRCEKHPSNRAVISEHPVGKPLAAKQLINQQRAHAETVLGSALTLADF